MGTVGKESRYFKLYISQLKELVRLQDEDEGFEGSDRQDQMMRRMDDVWYKLTPQEQRAAKV